VPFLIEDGEADGEKSEEIPFTPFKSSLDGITGMPPPSTVKQASYSKFESPFVDYRQVMSLNSVFLCFFIAFFPKKIVLYIVLPYQYGG